MREGDDFDYPSAISSGYRQSRRTAVERPAGKQGKCKMKPTTKKRLKQVFITLGSIIALLAIVLLIDYGVAQRQDAIIKEKADRMLQLQKQAFYYISADIRDVVYTPDIESTDEYEVIIRIDNVFDEEPVYVSHPELQAYMSTGSASWIELPFKEKPGEPVEQMYKVEGKSLIIKKLLTIDKDIPYTINKMGYYMRIKTVVRLNIMPESGFQEGEIVERKGPAVIFVKPYYISREKMREVMEWGETKVPIYMPITAFRKWDKEKNRPE